MCVCVCTYMYTPTHRCVYSIELEINASYFSLALWCMVYTHCVYTVRLTV